MLTHQNFITPQKVNPQMLRISLLSGLRRQTGYFFSAVMKWTELLILSRYEYDYKLIVSRDEAISRETAINILLEFLERIFFNAANLIELNPLPSSE
jgi:hypothetical protein